MTAETRELQRNQGSAAEKAQNTEARCIFSPRSDVYETGDALFVVADMPGVDEEGLQVTLEKNMLTIEGRTRKATPEGYRQVYGGYPMGDYERRIVLAEGVDRDHIEATLKNGVMRLRLPKAKEAIARSIPVRAA
jgi:HSP20 family molecular chaperone IbpA